MAFDADPLVRIEVAERLPLAQLHLLASDSDLRVRFRVAERIAEEELAPFLGDCEALIREVARERIARVPSLAGKLLGERRPQFRVEAFPTPDQGDPQ
jgi:hypothetical protein